MKEVIANLLKVKSLMTITVSIGLIYGFVTGKIDAAQFMTIAVMVFTFYFAKGSKNETVVVEEKANAEVSE